MRCDEYDSPAALTTILSDSKAAPICYGQALCQDATATYDQYNHTYGSSLASLASASSTSVSSDSSSQSSDEGSDEGSLASSISAPSSSADSDSCDSYRRTLLETSQPQRRDCTTENNADFSSWFRRQQSHPPTSQTSQSFRSLRADHAAVPAEQRQHPRRSSSCSTTRSGCPPTLVRQADRKVNFVDNLVDSATQIVEAIWPTSSALCRNEASNSVLPLRTFIQETLRRSRTSYSTLQVALYYLILVKPHVPERDFTMEQADDCHASRVLQCGRRMFLAALILASKYLQDRNYSARAWSKISGLATREINQNEMAFLLAVNWKLHVTNEIYTRWTECVMKFTPPQPPSPGGAAQRVFERQCEDFRSLVLKLTPGLENVEHLVAPASPTRTLAQPQALRDFTAASSPRSLFSSSPPADKPCTFTLGDVREATVTSATPPRALYTTTPTVLEPSPATVYTPGRLAPALGLLPTPRLTPQTGFSTPAVSAASYLLKGPAMGLAMAQASCANAAHTLDRWTDRWTSTSSMLTSSPQSYYAPPTRRSSLANSISTASSPESMMSDSSSRTSRSSSISSASSLASAPSSCLKLDVQARCRYAKLCNERLSLRPTIIASVPEDYEENSSCAVTSSPEPYTGPVGKDSCEMDDNDAARALQDLHNYHVSSQQLPPPVPKLGSKRSRPLSIDNGLHDQVRDLLKDDLPRARTPTSAGIPASGSVGPVATAWPDTLVRPTFGCGSEQVPVRAALRGGHNGHKRVCCSTEAAQQFPISSIHPAVGGMGGPGMWDGILN